MAMAKYLALFFILCIIGPWYSNGLDKFHRSPLFVIRHGEKLGYMDASGRVVIPVQFDRAGDFLEGVAGVEINGKSAFIDETGKILFQLSHYTSVGSYYDGFAHVEVQRSDELRPHVGFINHAGKQLIPLKFRGAGVFSEGFASVADKGGRWGYIDTKGEWIIQPKFEGAGNFYRGHAIVRVNGLQGVIDTRGKFLVQPSFVLIGQFENQITCAWPHDGQQKWGLINLDGEIVAPPKFDWCDGFHDGVARVEIAHKWGFLNEAGDFIIQPQFDDVNRFDEGLAAVEIEGKWGFVNLRGEFIIQPQYSDATGFTMGLATVQLEDRWMYIDRTGKRIQYVEID